MTKYGKILNAREMLIRIDYIKKLRIATETMSMYEQGWVKIQNHNFFHPSSVEYPSYGCCSISQKAGYMIKKYKE